MSEKAGADNIGKAGLGMGTLYVCATPIGNLGDITLRVLDTLRRVDLIAAEDTRHTRKLLSHYGISTALTSYHEHNEQSKTSAILQQLEQGADVALVSDAGLPGISDPGGVLIRACRERQVPVDVLPGANAALTALVLSGFDSQTFFYAGFLPVAGKKRRQALSDLAKETSTLILYEAPHRLLATLQDLQAALGDRQAALARELTKIHQELLPGKLSTLAETFTHTSARGECCLLVAAAAPEGPPPRDPAAWQAVWQDLRQQGMEDKQALKEVARRFRLSRRDVYQALKIKPQSPAAANTHEREDLEP